MVQQVYDYRNVGGNYFDKYNDPNPLVRLVMQGFLGAFDEFVSMTGARDVLEVGCGEGHLSLRMLRGGLRVRGIDLDADAAGQARAAAIAHAYPATFHAQDLYTLASGERAELVVCCEVLEHVPEPGGALEILRNL